MGRRTLRTRVTRVTGGESRDREDVLAVEEPLELRIDGEALTVTMRTPGHDIDLALGFLLAEGVITHEQDVLRAAFCAPPGEPNTYNVLDVTLRVPAPAARRVLTTSACGICGRRSIEEVRTASAHDVHGDGSPITLDLLTGLPDRVRAHQALFDQTGGLHAAALVAADGELLVVREDVGRHNAVDKVLGWALRERGLPLRSTVLFVSGRASFELVQKAHVAGVATLAAVSAPSSLAVELAREVGMTLVGFLRGDSLNVYAGEQRLEGCHGPQATAV